MSKSKELSEFDRGSIVGCHLCGKSVREIADILQKPKSTVSDIIVKWKRRDRISVNSRSSLLLAVAVKSLKTSNSMAVQLLTSQTSSHRMRSIDCNGVELTIIGLGTCGKLFFGVMNLALKSGSRMDLHGRLLS
ncbi:hypothetical protein TNCV_1726601 [Trichonephila clavipes]|nr:hypothetical protein TNCV_1726601 [Trichonephila clavipes]